MSGGLSLDLSLSLGVNAGVLQIDALTLLRPLSYIKAIPNEYNGGAGLGAGNTKVGGTFHGVAYDDMGSEDLQVWFPHYAASAGQGEWSTGGTLTGKASVLFIDNSGAVQIANLLAGAAANPFEDFKLSQSGIRPKVGSHYWINWLLTFTNSGYYSHARADYANGEGLMYGAGTPDYVGSATLYGNTWNGGGDYYGPSFVGGKLARPTYALSGDSNNSGVLTGGVIADVPDTLQGGIGAMNRLLTPFMAGIDVSIPGGTAFEMADPTKTACRDRLMKIGGATTKRFYALGTNDILFNDRTSAQVKADTETAMLRHGVQEADAFVATITPVITAQSTNTVPNAGREAIRQAENTRRRARSNKVDISLGVENGTTGTFQRTSDEVDGTHLNAAGNNAAVAGSGFDVAAKTGALAVNAGIKPTSGALYQTSGFSGWSPQQAAIQADPAYSPEHKLNAAVIKEDASSNRHTIFTQQTLALASTTKKVACYVKRITGTRNVQIQVQQAGGSYQSTRLHCDLGDGTMTKVEEAAGAISGQAATLVDGYWKIEFNVAFGSSHPSSSYLYVCIDQAPYADNYAGDNASEIAVWDFSIG